MTFRWGILATGNIANSMAEALDHVEDADLVAVASRTAASANAFAEHWGVSRAYEGYDSLLADPDIDIVYVATPNQLHRDNVVAALKAGKHVLCEKPLTTSAEDSRACAALARVRNLFLMEAMWSSFLPAMREAVRQVQDGAIGTPRFLCASFISARDPKVFPNLFDPALGGGACLDLGVYPLTVAQLLAGPVASCAAALVQGPTGVDEMAALSARHENGVISQLSAGFRAEIPAEARIVGDLGELVLPDPFYRAVRLRQQINGEIREVSLPYLGNGYVHQVIEVQSCLERGLIESPLHPAATAIRTAELLEQVLETAA